MVLQKYLTWDELLKEFNCSKRTVYRWQAKQGFPRPVRTPGGMLFARHLVQEWMRKKEIPLDDYV